VAVDLTIEQFMLSATSVLKSNFTTARAAAFML